ncbi:MAG: NPCBM/NEW2 domain-containing protein [Planctomycetota bacterium]|nr:NPCBM/NEW2 domain-containing protein [Planctomycetota bacterium]
MAAAIPAAPPAISDDVILTDGSILQRTVHIGRRGSLSLGDRMVASDEVLAVRFARAGLPERLSSAVLLADGTMLAGEVRSAGSASIRFASESLEIVELPREKVAAIYLAPVRPGEIKAAAIAMAAGRSDGAGHEDRIFVSNGDEVPAPLLRIEAEEVSYRGKEGIRRLSRGIVVRIHCRLPDRLVDGDGSGKRTDGKAGPVAVVRLKNGDLLRGDILRLDSGEMLMEGGAAGTIKIPRRLLMHMHFEGGRAEFLSARKPAAAKHIPLFDAHFPHKADLSVSGEIMRVGDWMFDVGIGAHSRSEITWDTGGAYKRLVALCGLDAAARGRGEVEFIVLADGKEIFRSGTVTGKDPPKPISVPIAGAGRITLVTDFGPGGDDSGDHADWGLAAVVRD